MKKSFATDVLLQWHGRNRAYVAKTCSSGCAHAAVFIRCSFDETKKFCNKDPAAKARLQQRLCCKARSGVWRKETEKNAQSPLQQRLCCKVRARSDGGGLSHRTAQRVADKDDCTT